MRTKSPLLSLVSIPLMAQVSSVAFSDSKDVVPAFDSSGAITLPAARLKVDIAYPHGKKERCELTVVYRVRLYVPFGKAWYPYYMRRLAERPANVFFMLRNLFRR